MRMDQYIGLNKWATRKVNRKVKVREVGVRTFPGGTSRSFDRWTRLPLARRTVIGTIPGAYKDVAGNLYRYTFSKGEYYEEFVQATPWSGGPCYHIALKDRHGNVVPQSKWTDDELANC
jgi:hypothetical protein